MAERTGTCEVCAATFFAPGARGRVPKRCSACALNRKVAYNRERYRRNPPAPKIRAPRETRFRAISCSECGGDFQVQIKPGGFPKACDRCKHDRRIRLARETVRSAEFRLRRRLYRHGLTVEQWQSMMESQDGRCAICRRPPAGEQGRSALLEVDHCHDTGRVRALLCQACNTSLGKFQDSPELLRKAADYIEFYRVVDDRVSQEK